LLQQRKIGLALVDHKVYPVQYSLLRVALGIGGQGVHRERLFRAERLFQVREKGQAEGAFGQGYDAYAQAVVVPIIAGLEGAKRGRRLPSPPSWLTTANLAANPMGTWPAPCRRWK
jgi:hypothetical protein